MVIPPGYGAVWVSKAGTPRTPRQRPPPTVPSSWARRRWMPARPSVTAWSPPPEPWLPARRVLGAEGFANVALPAHGARLGAELLGARCGAARRARARRSAAMRASAVRGIRTPLKPTGRSTRAATGASLAGSVRSPAPRASPATRISDTPTAPAPSSRRARRPRDRTPQAARDREPGFRSATRSRRGCRARRAVPSSSSAAGTRKPPPRASSAKKSSRGAVLALTPPNPASGARETQHCARPAQNGMGTLALPRKAGAISAPARTTACRPLRASAARRRRRPQSRASGVRVADRIRATRVPESRLAVA